jgi:predicted acetyltransferase
LPGSEPNERDGVQLVWPSAVYLDSYVAALEQGWSPNNIDPNAGREELQRIADDPVRFIAEQVDREAKAPAIVMPDGTALKRIPGYRKWIWDGELCGAISLRWQPGTTVLPPYVLGHIGFTVVPWKRGRGYAKRALALMLPEARAEGLPFVELTTDITNAISRRVIEANGGRLIERFRKPEIYGGTEGFRFRIDLSDDGCAS